MLIEFFTDPILRGPSLGSLFMGASSALVGCFAFLQKRTLIAETLTHAAYPGVMCALLLGGAFLHFGDSEEMLLTALILLGGSFFSLLSLVLLSTMVKKLKFSLDASLCFIIAVFFGLGITLASTLQFRFSSLYRSSQSYLFGQSATMTDTHILLFAVFFLFLASFITFFYRELKTILFDSAFAKLLGMNLFFFKAVMQGFLIVAVILGIRSAGVVLMSAFLIAPPLAARQCTHHLGSLFILSSLIGAFSGFMGNVLSYSIPGTFSLPTGPLITLIASFIALTALCFPRRTN